jgi:hypothetical protein
MYDEVARLVDSDRALYSSVADFAQAAIREEIRKARRRTIIETKRDSGE